MEAYTDFATVYDTFMDETPYETWKEMLVDILRKDNIKDGIVLDLGCGTGKMTRLLQEEGYDMIGVDMSFEMLNVARAYSEEKQDGILYLCQDMREFELYGTVRAVVSVCDCINYLLEDDDIIKTFSLVNNYLDKDGLFIFDFNTTHKYKDVIGTRTIAENRDNCSFIWDNEYDEESRINEYDLTLFVREDMLFDDASEQDEDLMFGRFTERHLQKAYELSDMIRFLEAAGMEYVRSFDTDSMGDVNADSQRITVIAREKYNKDKKYV